MHDVNPPCVGHISFLELTGFYDAEKDAYVLPHDLPDWLKSVVAGAYKDKANDGRNPADYKRA